MIKKISKQGSELFTAYWFFMVGIVVLILFLIVYQFYKTPYDVRGVETTLLLDRIADCVSYTGRLNSNFLNQDSLLGEICSLDFADSTWDEEQLYVKVEIYNLEDFENPISTFELGNEKWTTTCVYGLDEKQKTLPLCLEERIYSLGEDGKSYLIKLLAVVRKTEKNANS